MQLQEVGEVELIKEFIRIIKDIYPTNTPLRLGDDASSLSKEVIKGRYLILKVDGTSILSSLYPWMNFSDLGYRVALATATDMISKGARVLAFMVSIGLPKTTEVEDAKLLIQGIRELCVKLGSWLLGGDTNSCNCSDGWLDIFGIGVADNVISNKFSESDEIYLTKCLGLSAIPAITHYRGLNIDEVMKVINLKKIIRPEPPKEFLELTSITKASTDISDGLASISKVLSVLGLDLILNTEIPLCKEVKEFMEYFNVSIYDVLKYLGEEYVIAFTVKEGHLHSLNNYPLLGKLVRGNGRIIYKGKEVRFGWDNFKGYLS